MFEFDSLVFCTIALILGLQSLLDKKLSNFFGVSLNWAITWGLKLIVLARTAFIRLVS